MKIFNKTDCQTYTGNDSYRSRWKHHTSKHTHTNTSKGMGTKPSQNLVLFRITQVGIWFCFLILGVIGDKSDAFLTFLKVQGWKSDYPSVQRLLTYVEKCRDRNERTRDNLLYPVYRLCKLTKLNPDQLILRDNSFLNENIRNYLFKHEPQTADAYKTGLKRFFCENHRQDLDYPNFPKPSRDEIPRYSITLEDAWKMVYHAGSLKAAFLILMLFITGIRNSTIRAIKLGVVITKNPTFKNLSLMDELSRGEKNPIIIIYKGMRDWVPRACKCKIFYYVFLHDCAMEYLLCYLDYLKRKYGPLERNMFLFPSESRQLPHNKKCTTPMSDSNINEIVRKAARNAGLKNWEKINASTLRDLYYDTLKNQWKRTSMSVEDREFSMGHRLQKPVENYFNIEKINEMREKFQLLNFTSINQQSNDYLEMLARHHGIHYDFILQCAKERYGEKPTEAEIEKVINEIIENQKEYRIIAQDEVEDYLNNGYKIETWTPVHKAVMSRSTMPLTDQGSSKEKSESTQINKLTREQLKEKYKQWVTKRKEKKEMKRRSGQQDISGYFNNT